MLRTLAILLAVLVAGPVGCDEPIPDDHSGDETTSATESGDETGDETGTGEAIDPTPIPFQPPLRKDCHAAGKSTRIRDCDP